MNAISVCYRHPKIRKLVYELLILLFLLLCVGVAMYKGFIGLDFFPMGVLVVEIVFVGTGLIVIYRKWREIGDRKRMSEIKQYPV